MNERPNPSPISSPSRESTPAVARAPAQASELKLGDATALAAAMLSTMSAPTIVLGEGSAADDIADNRSSSLSELGDASDAESEPTPRPNMVVEMEEDDSEAETERLESTPRKPTRNATDASLSEALYTRTPSKLAHSRTIEQDDSAPPTPSAIVDDTTLPEDVSADNPLHSLSLVATSEAASLDYAGRKRKRLNADRASLTDKDDEPARKRSSTSKTLNDLADIATESADHVDADEELDNAEERLSQLAHEEIDLEERQANIAAETVNELTTVAKHTKPRKGGRRGKRKIDDSSYAYGEGFQGVDTNEGEGEGEVEEEDGAVVDEEVAKKKMAIDKLAEIEKKFKVFREK